MNRIVNAIQVDEKNIADIFKLPCVYQICKTTDKGDADVWIYLNSLSEEYIYKPKASFIAKRGEWLCQLSDDKWLVLTDKQYQTIKQNNYVLH